MGRSNNKRTLCYLSALAFAAMGTASAAPEPIVILSADSLVSSTNGGGLLNWPNSVVGSGGEFSATARADSAPHVLPNALNKLPAVHFDASKGEYMDIERPVQNDFTIVAVFRSKQGIGTGTAYFQGAGLVQGEVPGVVSDFGLALNANGQVLGGTGFPDVTAVSGAGFNDGKAHIAVLTRVRKSGDVSLVVDHGAPVKVVGGTQCLVAPAQLGIGSLPGDGLNFDGDIAEIEIFDTALTDEERQTVETSLALKWGVSLN